jgi:mRNA-degrading endonuclease RelE of RelBE toxin-antitoxin system
MPKYNFTFLPKFQKDYKEAKKKNYQLDDDFSELLQNFDHTKGDTVSHTNGAQKIRMSRANMGKSSGYRIYYYFAFEDKIYLLRMYAKSEKEELDLKSKIEIAEIISAIKSCKN